jgi:SNF2 family DNA or RNA helicase
LTPSSKESTSLRPLWNPHDYQRRAIQLLLSQAAAGLFLDPGLGKTSICLAALKILFSKGLAKRCLIVAPLRPMYSVWPGEIRKWREFEEMSYTILHGKVKETSLRSSAQIHLINPEGLQWLLESGRVSDYDVLIIDESSKFKDSQTKRFKLLKSYLHLFKRRWILTGTPVPNGLLDLFGQMFILDLGRSLGRFITHYRREFFLPDFTGYNWTPQPNAFPRIIERISPLLLQLSAEDYLKMPELDCRTISVSLPPSVMIQYKSLQDEFIAKTESGEIVAANSAVASGKCRQVANGAVYHEDTSWTPLHDEKLDALESLLEELNGHPVLVLYEFDHDRQRILGRIPDVVDLRGMDGRRLDTAIDSFNRGTIDVLLGHPASMGHGLNLQGSCHHVIWFGITWNLEHYDQAIARVYRQGQRSSHVFVYHIVAKDTLDETVVKTLTAKDRTQQDLLRGINEFNKNYDA